MSLSDLHSNSGKYIIKLPLEVFGFPFQLPFQFTVQQLNSKCKKLSLVLPLDKYLYFLKVAQLKISISQSIPEAVSAPPHPNDYVEFRLTIPLAWGGGGNVKKQTTNEAPL